MRYSKDGITVAAVLDTRRQKTSGDFPVKIRVTFRRSRTYYNTGKNLSVSDWERLDATRLHALVDVRKDIENSFNLVKSAVEELANKGDFSIELLNVRIKGGSTNTINSKIRGRIIELQEQSRYGTADSLRSVLYHIESMSKGETRFDEVSVLWLNKLEKYLLSCGKTLTTIAIYMRNIRTIMNDAKKSGVIKESQYPFGRGKYEIHEGESRKKALSLEQIGMIAKYTDEREDTERFRDYWLFLYLCNGINVADFVKLRYRDIVDGEICFVRQKTQNRSRLRKEIKVPISSYMQAIIDRWGNTPEKDNMIFPILKGTESDSERYRKTKLFTRALNLRIKRIGAAMGIDNISTYTARHSFATVLKRAGANIAYISESLGHNDIRTTEHYLASFEREERERNAQLLTQF